MSLTEAVYQIGAPEKSEPLSRSDKLTLRTLLQSGQLSREPLRKLSLREKLQVWMINEGSGWIFTSFFVLAHLVLFSVILWSFQTRPNATNARVTFGVTFAVAKAAAQVLHFDLAILILPICRTLITYLRQTALNRVVKFDKNIHFHKLVGCSLVVFSWIHTIAHWNNFAQLSAKNNAGFLGFLQINFTSGPGWSGYIMLTVLMLIACTSIEKVRRAHFERFWYIHHLFIVLFIFWSVHGEFCMIKFDSAPFCSGDGFFYAYWIAGAAIYGLERLAREIRGAHRTYISKVVQHPSDVCEIQIKKEHIRPKAGQYIFLCCPEISLYQYHPFTLTSAPEEDFVSVHIRCQGEWTRRLARVLGCDFSAKTAKQKKQSQLIAIAPSEDKAGVLSPAFRRVMPRVFVDGPFGTVSEDVFKYEIAVLVGAGIGVTPFASILKSIWYQFTSFKGLSKLKKVYFFWVCRDFGSFEWFRSLLAAIESQDLKDRIEIFIYLTAKIKPDDVTNIQINTSSDIDAVTGLAGPTSFGRPNWDSIFRGVAQIHLPGTAGVFYCGPKALGSQLHVKCNMYSSSKFKFHWGKENF